MLLFEMLKHDREGRRLGKGKLFCQASTRCSVSCPSAELILRRWYVGDAGSDAADAPPDAEPARNCGRWWQWRRAGTSGSTSCVGRR